MAQRQISFEWFIGEHDFAYWNLLASPTETNYQPFDQLLSSAERRLLIWLFQAATAIAVIVMVATGAPLSEQQVERERVQAGIQATVAHEMFAWHSRDWHAFNQLIDSQIESYWMSAWRDPWRSDSANRVLYHVEVLDVEVLSPSLTAATVSVTQPDVEWWHSSPYRERRYYLAPGSSGAQASAPTWLRTVPGPEFWGEKHELETAHLRFSYYDPDAKTMETIAPELDAQYVAIHALLNMSPPSTQSKLTIIILPDRIKRWISAGDNRMDIMSPHLSKIPQGMSDRTYLQDEILDWLVYRALRDASPAKTGSYLYRWPVITWALRGWLRVDLLGASSQWHQEAQIVFQEQTTERLPLLLDDIYSNNDDHRPTREFIMWRYMAAESLVAYIAETYGREYVAEFVQGLISNRKWSELIPAVFGLSLDEFVSGWNQYLRDSLASAQVQ